MQQTNHSRLGLKVAGGIIVCALACILWLAYEPQSLQGSANKVIYYQDSMHPWIKSDRPGKCTICAMDLTPILEGQRGLGGDDVVMLSSNSVTVLNVQTEEIRREALSFALKVAGTLDPDESRKAVFSAPASGRIEEMEVESVGQEIQAEQRLFTFYSPELATWRRAYVIRNRSSTLTTPFFAGKPSPTLRTPELRSNVLADTPSATAPSPSKEPETDPYFSDLLSPLSGTVVERKVFNGQYVSEGDRLLTIVDTSLLWFRFDVYERQIAWIHKGQKVLLHVPACPGRQFTAVISMIEPVVDEATRTVKVRADVQNGPEKNSRGQAQRPLRLGMYAEGQVVVNVANVLCVPKTAVLSPGGQPYAYVQQDSGGYAIRALRLGRQGDTHYEVLDGLKEGDMVVSAGNLLIDSQAQLTMPIPNNRLTATFSRSAEPLESAKTSANMTEGVEHEHKEATPVAEEIAGFGRANAEDAVGTETDKASNRKNIAAAQRAGSGLSAGTANNRHPEAKERMARSFGVGLAERHRAAAEVRLASEIRPTKAPSEREQLSGFLDAADAVSRALAADDLVSLNKESPRLAAAVGGLAQQSPEGHPWHEIIEGLGGATRWPQAKSLEEARKYFLPFSTKAVQLLKVAKKTDPALASVKIYHCSMAPKPGLWLQTKGPLRNPYYGAKMLMCGEEVRP